MVVCTTVKCRRRCSNIGTSRQSASLSSPRSNGSTDGVVVLPRRIDNRRSISYTQQTRPIHRSVFLCSLAFAATLVIWNCLCLLYVTHLGLIFGSFAGATVWRVRARQLIEDKRQVSLWTRRELKRLSHSPSTRQGKIARGASSVGMS